MDDTTFQKTQESSKDIWTKDFVFNLYGELSKKSVYITNLAKCTQDDARALKDKVFEAYLLNTFEEIYAINPVKIISFGNQVSSILLGKKIQVSNYKKNEKEILNLKNKTFNIYPVYYPVGQGMRNINKTISRIKSIL